MKYILLFVSLFVITSCADNTSVDETNEYTGRELQYDLVQASDYPISGSVIFKERTDKTVEIDVILSGTEGDTYHPVHLHSDDLSKPDAEIAVLLNDLSGKSGESKTIIKSLSDETPFHFEDVAKLLDSFNELVEQGHSVIIIEHNLDIIKCADWIIDIGPEGGFGGGQIVAEGTPEEIMKVSESYTGQFLKDYLG